LGTSTPGQSLEKKDRGSSDKPSPISEKETQKPLSFAQTLRERYGIEPGKKSAPRPHIDQEYPPFKKQFQGEDKTKSSDLNTIKNILNTIKLGKSTADATASGAGQTNQPETKKTPYEPRSPMPWYETKQSLTEPERTENRTQMVIENEGFDDNRNEETNTRAAPPMATRDMSYSYRPKSIDKVTRAPEGSGVSQTYKASMNQIMERARTQAQVSPNEGYNKHVQYPKYQPPKHQGTDQYRRSSTSAAAGDFSWSNDRFDYSPKFPRTTEKQSNYYTDSQQVDERSPGNTQSQGKDYRSSQITENQENTQNKGKTSQDKSASKEFSRSTATSDNTRDSLINQWIDQKVNGFLVFQNTLKDQTPSHTDFARYCSDKWFHLSKAERDEYTVLALGVRSELKQEFKDMSFSTSDLSQLQQLLDERIKQVKK